jgi:hypothetical protein
MWLERFAEEVYGSYETRLLAGLLAVRRLGSSWLPRRRGRALLQPVVKTNRIIIALEIITIQFFVYLRAYSTDRRPIIKQARSIKG